MDSIRNIIESYESGDSLESAWTIPASWYTEEQVYALELSAVFARSWQVVARVDQLQQPGRYVTAEIAGEPLLIVRGSDNTLRGFFNVPSPCCGCNNEAEGSANQLRCPYHGWTYSLEGDLKGTPDSPGSATLTGQQTV